jgi:hypothetical protein
VDDSIAVPLERGAESMLGLLVAPASRARARGSIGGEELPLLLLEIASIGHEKALEAHTTPSRRGMSKLAGKEKRAETSFEVRPLFRAYD